MVHISENELKTLNFLIRHFTEKYSINQLAKKLGITPKGLHKLLKRLEENNPTKRKSNSSHNQKKFRLPGNRINNLNRKFPSCKNRDKKRQTKQRKHRQEHHQTRNQMRK